MVKTQFFYIKLLKIYNNLIIYLNSTTVYKVICQFNYLTVNNLNIYLKYFRVIKNWLKIRIKIDILLETLKHILWQSRIIIVINETKIRVSY